MPGNQLPLQLHTATFGPVRPARQKRRCFAQWRLTAKGRGKARKYPRATIEALQHRLLRGIGIATSNGYLVVIKGFMRWLVDRQRTDRDRLVPLPRLDAKADPRSERRALEEPAL